MRLILILLILASLLPAQTGRAVVLTWADTANPAGTTYNVYRGRGGCSSTTTFSPIASAVSTKTYTDSTVQPGNYCYYVTAAAEGVESDPSNSAGAQVKPFPPTQLQVTVK
jgi:hypothetical protein